MNSAEMIFVKKVVDDFDRIADALEKLVVLLSAPEVDDLDVMSEDHE